MDIPLELQEQISLDLEYPEIINLCRTNKALANICSDPKFWRNKLFHDYNATSLHQLYYNLKLKESIIKFTLIIRDILNLTEYADFKNEFVKALLRFFQYLKDNVEVLTLPRYEITPEIINIIKSSKIVLGEINSCEIGTVESHIVSILTIDVSFIPTQVLSRKLYSDIGNILYLYILYSFQNSQQFLDNIELSSLLLQYYNEDDLDSFYDAITDICVKLN
jgi:hypothetical protein